MKSVTSFILIGLCLLLQFCLFTAWGNDLVIPNVTLAMLVVLSFYIDTEQIMWLALISGLFSDLYGASEFGLYLGLYILVVLVCKVVLRFGAEQRSWWLGALVLAGAAVLQAMMFTAPILGNQLGLGVGQLFEQIIWFGVTTALVGLVFWVLLQFANQVFGQYFQTKARVK